ncbi:tyrosine-type recombinase/integrase [Tenacibaculum sp.]|uniref:tyrosine-type recombinase/integrase n=1 Tax=Tenacibaculum sp. TaxID=1906242 RepID=UPI003D1432A5
MNLLTEAKDSFIFHCKFEKGLSSKTIKAYTSDIDQFDSFLTMERFSKELNKIDKVVLKFFLQFISTKKPKTIKRKIATLKALFSFLEFEDEILVNPFRKMRIQIKESKKLPSVLDISDIKVFFKTVYRIRDSFLLKETYSYKAITRDIAILELLFATGIRVSELCNLKYNNIGANYSSIIIKGKGDKERIIQICNKETKQALKEYKKLFKAAILQNGYFFNNRLNMPISDQSIRFMIRKYTLLSGIDKKITPHTFRHTFATLLLEEGVDLIYIQHLLGHSSIMTTQIYTHVNQVKQKRILRTKHPRKKFSLTSVE